MAVNSRYFMSLSIQRKLKGEVAFELSRTVSSSASASASEKSTDNIRKPET
jgi:hypothetical protein